MMRKGLTEVYIGLGSNLGDRAGFLKQAVKRIREMDDVFDVVVSSIWETTPWGVEEPEREERYLNAVARFSTRQEPLELLAGLQKIEQEAGRVRPYHWAPRTLDLDILLYGEEEITLPELYVPHPWMRKRLFVLLPLQEIAPQLIFPDGVHLEELISALIAKEGLQGITRTKETF